MRREGLPAVLGGHPPLGRRVRRAGLQPVRRARLHERPELPRPRRCARAVGRPHRRPPARRRRWPRHLQPRAAGRLPRLRRARRRRGGRGRDQRGRRGVDRRRSGRAHRRPAGAGRDRGRVRPRPLRGPLPARRAARGHGPDRPGRAGRRREAHHRRPGRLALPEAAARAPHRGGPRPAQRRGVPRLHPWLPVLPGRHDHPTGARAPGRPGHLDDPAGPPPHRLRRGRAHQPVHRRLLGHRGRGGHRHGRLGRLRQRVGEPAQPAGRRLHRRRSPPRSRRPVAPASPSPPRPAPGGCGR